MAKLFLEALTETDEFRDQFEEVVFAILERSGSENMRPWREVWRGVLGEEREERVGEVGGYGGGEGGESGVGGSASA